MSVHLRPAARVLRPATTAQPPRLNVAPRVDTFALPARPLLDLGLPKLPDFGAELQRLLLGPAYPTTPAGVAADTERILATLGPALDALPPTQKAVLGQIARLGMSPVDVFRGSQAVVADGGRLYDEWSQLGATPRISSHYPGVATQAFELSLPGVGVLLFGKDADGNTWFQLEAHSVTDVVRHGGDFLLHLLSGQQNIGPAGTSPHSEKRGAELHFADVR